MIFPGKNAIPACHMWPQYILACRKLGNRACPFESILEILQLFDVLKRKVAKGSESRAHLLRELLARSLL
jgi:hypothetical protein